MNENKLDSKLSVSDITLDTTEVVIKSSDEILSSVASVKALIDASQIDIKSSGEFEIENVPLVAYDASGNKISNIEIVPSKVNATLTIDSYSAEKPVKVKTSGTMTEGIAIDAISTSVTSVKIYGEKSVVDAIDNIEAVVNIDGLKENYKTTVELTTPTGIRYMSDTKTDVSITVGEVSEKTFEGISVETTGLSSGLSASAVSSSDRSVDVIVKGVKSVLDSEIKSDQIKVYVDLSGLKAGVHSVPVVVKIDDSRVSAVANPTEINVKIVSN